MSVAKSEKVGFVERVKRYFRGMSNEMKKVHWPNRKELFIYTAVVIVAVAFVGLIIWLIDVGISTLINFVLNLGA